jgi:hypothetical protein
MKIFFFIPFLILFVFSSCEKTFYLDLPQQENYIVVNAILNPDSTVCINLSKNLNPDQSIWAGLTYINNASVELLMPNGQILIPLYDTLGNYRLNYYPIPGLKYKLLVDVPNLPSVNAECEIPQKVKIDSLYFRDVYRQNSDYVETNVCFTDTDTMNYYFLLIQAVENIYSQNPALGNNFQNIDNLLYVFSDQIFNGSSFSAPFYMVKSAVTYSDSLVSRVFLQSLDDNYYKYLHTMQLTQKTKDNPMAEPIAIYSNIKNGMGIFGAYNASVDSFFIDKGKIIYPYRN